MMTTAPPWIPPTAPSCNGCSTTSRRYASNGPTRPTSDVPVASSTSSCRDRRTSLITGRRPVIVDFQSASYARSCVKEGCCTVEVAMKTARPCRARTWKCCYTTRSRTSRAVGATTVRVGETGLDVRRIPARAGTPRTMSAAPARPILLRASRIRLL